MQEKENKRISFFFVAEFFISALEIFWAMDKVAHISTQ
jgi:hypothetical protein